MAVTAFASGTQTAVIGSEHALPTTPFINAAGTYTLHIDKNKMENGDVVELRAYQRILEGGTTRVAYFVRLADAYPADDQIEISVPISNDLAVTEAVKFVLKQVRGTGREFPWKVLKYA
jgi:hypothetical protein